MSLIKNDVFIRGWWIIWIARAAEWTRRRRRRCRGPSARWWRTLRSARRGAAASTRTPSCSPRSGRASTLIPPTQGPTVAKSLPFWLTSRGPPFKNSDVIQYRTPLMLFCISLITLPEMKKKQTTNRKITRYEHEECQLCREDMRKLRFNKRHDCTFAVLRYIMGLGGQGIEPYTANTGTSREWGSSVKIDVIFV